MTVAEPVEVTGKKTPTYNQARTMVQKLGIDPAIVLSV